MRSSGRVAPAPSAVLLAALATLAACGGGGGSTTPATCTATPQVTVAAGESWRLIGPADWDPACASLTVNAPALAADERLALLLVNAGGPDNATPTLELLGTSAFADVPAPVAAVLPDPLAAAAPPPADMSARAEGDAIAIARRGAATAGWLAEGAPRLKEVAPRAVLPAAAPVVGDAWQTPGATQPGVCVYSYSTNKTDRYAATLRFVSDHALFYVTDAAWTGGVAALVTARPTLFSDLAAKYEGQILPALTASFGAETDVDGNGRMIFLMADLGSTGGGGFTVGYFDGTDVVRAADVSDHCTGTGSNHADMLYLLDPVHFNSHGYTYDKILNQETPGTMAHELQHNVMFNTRCWATTKPSCAGIDDPTKDLWLNEGLSMVSEDFAGFGLNGLPTYTGEADRVGRYLDCTARSATSLCYSDVSLTQWPTGSTPGDATGHYGGAHAFVRWLADQADQGRATAASGEALTKALVGSSLLSRPAVAAALGVPFEEAYARFATAAVFSSSDTMFSTYAFKPAPEMSYAAGVPWAPFHTKIGYTRYTSLPRPGGGAFPASLHADGWGAFVTGLGTGGAATLNVTSSASVKPRVAVVRFKGSLPNP